MMTTTLDILPRHVEAKQVALYVRPTLRVAHFVAHQMTVRRFQVIHQHCTPDHARSSALQPSYIIFNNITIDVSVVMVIADTHRDRSAVLELRVAVMLTKFIVTVLANRY